MSLSSFAAQKARVVQPQTEVYEFPDFDSSIIKLINPDEWFLASDKPQGPFYKVKFKNGRIGYIADTELFIDGKGEFKPKTYVEDEIENQKINSKNKLKSKNKKNQNEESDLFLDEMNNDDEDVEKKQLWGLTVSVFNYKEKFYGSDQVSDLTVLGFRSQPMPGEFDSALAYEVNMSLKPPSYFAEKTGGKSTGGILWGTVQISNVLPAFNQKTSFRYGAGPVVRASHIEVKTSQKTYTLQEIGVGLDFQAGLVLQLARWMSVDVGLRYLWEKNSYGALTIGFLF